MQVATAALKAFAQSKLEAQINHVLSTPAPKVVTPELQQWDTWDDEEEEDLSTEVDETTEEDKTQEYLDWLSNEILYSHAIW